MRSENTIYIRKRPAGPDGKYQTFVKARGEAAITSVEGSREENIEAAALVLWAINEFGPEAYHDEFPLDVHPRRPDPLPAYPVVDEV